MKKYQDYIENIDTDNVWHTYPVNDLKEHVVNGLKVCWCNPRIEKQPNDGLLVLHNSKDGRELKEKKKET